MPNLIGGSIVWNLDVDSKKYDAGLENARNKAKMLQNDLETGNKSLSGLQKSLENASSASFAFAGALTVVGAGLATAIGFGVKYAANLETMRAGFITLLGSADLADSAIKQIQKDAATTPFNFAGLVNANQLLTSVTKNSQSAERLLLNVGKALTAMGKGQPELDRIIVNLQQIGAVGHASAIDIKQFAFAGIPIYDMLNESIKGTGKSLDDMISNGEITFDLLTKLFQQAGEGSGRFSRAFIEQGGTMNQVWSNFIDNLGITASQLVKQTGLFDTLKDALKGATDALSYFASPAGTKQLVDLFNVLKSNLPVIIGFIVGGLTPAIYSLSKAFLVMAADLAPFIIAGAAVGVVILGIQSAFSKTPNAVLIGFAAGITAVGIALGVVFAPAAIAAAAGLWALIAPVLVAAAPFIALGLAVAAVVAAAVYLWQNWGIIWPKVVSIVQGVVKAVVGGFKNLIDWAKNLYSNYSQIFDTLLAVFVPFIGIPLLIYKNWDKIKNLFTGLGKVIYDFFTGGDVTATWYQYFKTAFIGVAILLDNLQNWFIMLPERLAAIGQAIATWFMNLPKMIADALVNIGLSFVRNLGFIVGLVIYGAPLIAKAIVDAIVAIPGQLAAIWTAISTAVVSTFNSILIFIMGIPAQLMAIWTIVWTDITTVFTNIWTWLSVNIPLMIGAVVAFFTALPGQIMAVLTTIWSAIVSVWTNIWGWLSTVVPQIINTVVSFFASLPGKIEAWLNATQKSVSNGFMNIWNAIVAEVSTWPQKLYDWGANIANAFVDGIKSAIGRIVDAFKEGLNKAKKVIEGHSPPVAGPFKDIDKWGFNVGSAWISGMKSAIAGFSLPQMDYSPSSIDYASGIIQSGDTNITHAPAINISLGNFIGTESEKRRFAYDLQIALDQYYKGRGQ